MFHLPEIEIAWPDSRVSCGIDTDTEKVKISLFQPSHYLSTNPQSFKSCGEALKLHFTSLANVIPVEVIRKKFNQQTPFHHLI